MADGDKKLDRAQQYFANERTFLSWLRTSIALVGLGFIIARFGLFLREFNLLLRAENNEGSNALASVADHSFSSFLGLSMVALGVALIIFAIRNYFDGNKEIESGVYVPKSKIIYVAATVLAVFGIVMIAYLIAISFI